MYFAISETWSYFLKTFFIEIVCIRKVWLYTVYSITRTKGIIKQLEGITKSDDRGDLRIYTMYNVLAFSQKCSRKNILFALLLFVSNTNMVQEVAPSHLLLPLQHDIYGEDVHSRHFMCLNLLLHKRNVKKLLLS